MLNNNEYLNRLYQSDKPLIIYKNDIKHGAFYNYIYIRSYDKGILNKPSYEKKISKQGNYKNGQLHGDYFEYWSDGSILIKKNW